MIVKTFSHLLFLPCVVKNPKDCLLTQPGCYPFLSPLCSVVFIRFVPLSRGTENGNRLWFSTILKMPSHWISSPSSLILSDRKLMNVFSLATYDSSWSELIKCYFFIVVSVAQLLQLSQSSGCISLQIGKRSLSAFISHVTFVMCVLEQSEVKHKRRISLNNK